MSPAPEPLPTTADAPIAAYAAALGIDPAALSEPAAEPAPAEAEIAESVGAYVAAAHASPVAFPSIAMQVIELVRYPDVDLNQLSRYIRMDGALAGGILALANSAAQRAVRRIDTVKDAVARLGISEVARLAAMISMKSLYSPDTSRAHERFAPVWTRLFLHAATVARCSSELAKQRIAPTPGVEQTFLAGLLHDVGRAAVLRAVAELSAFGKLPPLEDPVLGRVLQRLHVEPGVSQHRAWQLPPSLTGVAAHHHDASPPAGEDCAFVHLIRMVSALDLVRREPASHPHGPTEVVQSARVLGISPARLKAMAAELDAAEVWVKSVFPAT
jgi:HD-like signal output (HDOD) protein